MTQAPKVPKKPDPEPIIELVDHIPLWMLVTAFVIGAAVVILAIGLLPEKGATTDAAG